MSEILKASEAANLALHSMALLSTEIKEAKTAREMAVILQASSNHLSKVLLKMSKAGLVKSVRGPNGGFVLNHNADMITLKQIYEAVEGKITVSQCFFKIKPCNGVACAIGSVSRQISEQLEKVLTETKLSSLQIDIRLFKKTVNNE